MTIGLDYDEQNSNREKRMDLGHILEKVVLQNAKIDYITEVILRLFSPSYYFPSS